jgi:hypothetical protein
MEQTSSALLCSVERTSIVHQAVIAYVVFMP